MTGPEAFAFVVDDDESVRESLGGLIRSGDAKNAGGFFGGSGQDV
jgi:FixJ family two-component response regulator